MTTVAVGASITINEFLGPRIVRMILRAHPPAGGRMNLVVGQAGVQFTDMLEADTDLVFDAVA